MHNGFIDGFSTIKRDLALAIDESLYPEIEGTTDTETLFYLALSFGLADEPFEGVERAIGFVEEVGRRRGIQYAFQGTIATTDGERLWAFWYSTEGKSRSLFVSRDVDTLRAVYPHREILQHVSDDSRLVVSEPIGEMPGAWVEVPEATCGRVAHGDTLTRPFKPKPTGAPCCSRRLRYFYVSPEHGPGAYHGQR
jgi:glutamine amidotransferase